MISFFDVAKDDASITVLAQLFGTMGGIITTSASYGNITLLSEMFRSFNGVILTVGALMVVYITVTGVMITAHEGEFMGKKYHQVWTPIRTLIGIAALVPTYSGYSVIQLVMMWVIVQGIGAADVLWNTVLDYVQRWGSPYAQISFQSASASAALSSVFQALTCDEAARITSAPFLGSDKGNYFCALRSCKGVPPVFNPLATKYVLGPGGVCGTLNMCNHNQLCSGTKSNSMSCKVCEVQQAQLAVSIPILRTIAHNLVQRDLEYRDFYRNSNSVFRPDWYWIYNYCASVDIPRDQCCVNPEITVGNLTMTVPSDVCKATGTSTYFYPPNAQGGGGVNISTPSPEAVSKIYYPFGSIIPPNINQNFMGTIVSAYGDAINTVVTDKINELAKKKSNPDLEKSAKTGWMYAGGYYYIIAQMNNTNNYDKNAGADLSVSGLSVDFMADYRNDRNAADALANIAAGNEPSQLSNFANTQVAQNSASDVKATLNVLGTSTSNPISQMQMTGSILLTIAQVVFVAFFFLSFGISIVGNISFYVLGTGMDNPVGPTWATMSMIIIPAMFALLGIMVTLGGMLSVYVPLIPFTVFTFGAIGWVISTVEAMVAGPLVALGILSPSGQHEIMGKAEPALMLLFSIFLRPSLMVFGLMAGMLMATAVAGMINSLFWHQVAAGIASGGGMSGDASSGSEMSFLANPLQGIIFISAYVSLIVSAMNKCFSAIHIVPERVLAWIGGQAAQTGGEGEGLGEMKSGVTSASSGGAGAMAAGHAKHKEKQAALVSAKEKSDEKQRKKAKGKVTGVADQGGQGQQGQGGNQQGGGEEG